ncbi:cytochrome P450 [Wolfiporia cocos MD-104 SS10]|uniref:Cytochrome P450 n=1 Tax=Wolfiporia cocos (strain MD-104) TaxID=742152 RepID=A0A2H3JIF9_WOLCO|nr:cytochrome P450 [Wolfiporia cocos MD-104 SS10]
MILLCLAALLTLFLVKRVSNGHTLAEVPGPRMPSWLFGHGLQLQKAPVGAMYNRWAQRYGPTYKIGGAFGTLKLVLGDPKGAAHVLSSSNFVRPAAGRRMLVQFFGESLFSTEGDEHRRQRSVLNSAFTLASVRDVSNVIFDLAKNLAITWEEELDKSTEETGQIIEITGPIHRVALDAISMTAFAYDVGNSDHSIPELISKISNVPQSPVTLLASALADVLPVLTRLPSPMKEWTTMLRTELGRIADEVWSQAQESSGPMFHSKLLDSMNGAEEIHGVEMSRDRAIAQIVGVLFAGYETTANVIGECLYELARCPQVQEKLRKELVQFISKTGREPTFDDLFIGTQLPYLDAVTRETLRTKAVLMVIAREAVEHDKIPLLFPTHGVGSPYVLVNPGQIVYIPVRDGINVDKTIWGPDAGVFRPERWLEDGALPDTVNSIHAPGHLMTFGDGPKICLGRNFAIAEFKIVVSTLVRHFTFAPDRQLYDFYRTGGNTVKPKVRGREHEGVQLSLCISKFHTDE